MHKISKIISIATICFFIASALCAEEYDYINITNPSLNKIPIAVPLFKAMSNSEVEMKFSKTASALLSETLEFTGYFKLLNHDSTAIKNEERGIIGADINFQDWTSIGVEFLVTCGILAKNNIIEMEFRLYDTVKKQLIIGKKYKGWIDDQRTITHRFCSEIIFNLTGNRGVIGSKIAFVSNGSGNKEIYLCEFDGYNPKQLTHNKTITIFPAWSYDAKWIAYTSYAKGNPDIYIKHLRQKRGAIVAQKGINITPSWIPNRLGLGAVLSFSGDQEIYLLTETGKIIKRLTYNRGIDISPSFSPDGKMMAFVSKRSGSPQIHIMDLSSEKVRRLTFQGKYNTQPCWSPKGEQIAYSAMTKGQIDIFVIDVNNGNPIQLTYNAGSNESPSWSPDGSLIAFSSTRKGSSKIYVMTAYGTEQRCLLTLPKEQTEPKWSPSIF